MRFLIALLASLFFALPAWAAEIQMGVGGMLVFEPCELTVDVGESCLLYTSPSPRDRG